MSNTSDPHAIVILDRRPEYARLLAALAVADQPAWPIVTFEDLDEAERWVAHAAAPVMVLADVTAQDGAAIARAQSWRRDREVTLVAMFDANDEVQAQRAQVARADGTFAKPCCRSEWSRSFGALLGPTPVAALA